MKTQTLKFTALLFASLIMGCSMDQETTDNSSVISTEITDVENTSTDGANFYQRNSNFELPVNPAFIKIVYESNPSLTAAEKMAKRSEYWNYLGTAGIISCPSDSDTEIWVVDNDVFDRESRGPDKLKYIEQDPVIERAQMNDGYNCQ